MKPTTTEADRRRINREFTTNERTAILAGLRPDATEEEKARVLKFGRVGYFSAGAKRERH